MKASTLRLAIVLALASLAIVGRLAFVWLPNVSLSILVIAIAGFAYGVRTGAAVGFLSRLGSDILVSGLNPVLLPMTLVDTALGASCGVLGHVLGGPTGWTKPTMWTRILLFDIGVAVTLLYSVAADSVTWVFYNLVLRDAPDAARGALWSTLVFLGLLFNILPSILHGLLFAVAVPPIFRGLDAASLLDEKHSSNTIDPVDSAAPARGQ